MAVSFQCMTKSTTNKKKKKQWIIRKKNDINPIYNCIKRNRRCWRRLLRGTWTVRRWNQSIPKEISLEYSLEGLMLKLKLQYFDHLIHITHSHQWVEESTHWKRSWCWERLRSGREGGDRGWNGWMASLTQWIWVWVTLGESEEQEPMLQVMGCRVKHNLETEIKQHPRNRCNQGSKNLVPQKTITHWW